MFLDVHSRKPQLQQAVQAGPVPGLVASSGSGAKGVFVRASLQKCDCLQLLVNSEDLKLNNGNFKQKQGGHPDSLSLDYAIIFWVQVRRKILHIFSDTLGKVKWHLSVLSQT